LKFSCFFILKNFALLIIANFHINEFIHRK